MEPEVAFLSILVIALLVICKNLIVTIKRVEEQKEQAVIERNIWSDDYFELNDSLVLECTKNAEFIKGWQERYGALQEQNVELRVKTIQLMNYLENSVFYDRNNDTIVIATELEKLGDL
jgi:hypothetical protein